jgi:beta-lactamase class A
LLRKLVTGQIISIHACEQMILIMKKQQINHTLPSQLPEQHEGVIGEPKRWEIAHKTGYIPGFRHDVGIFYVGKRKLIASILSKGLDDIKSQELFGNIGLEIYRYLENES